MHHSIRKADLEDLEAICNIERESFTEDRQSTIRSIKRSLSSDSQSVWLAEVNGTEERTIVGAMVLHKRSNSLRVYSLAVKSGYQGHGIGNSLLGHAALIAKKEKFPRLSLEVDESNTKLVTWYLNQGYKIEKHLPDYYSRGKHALRLSKNPLVKDPLSVTSLAKGSNDEHGDIQSFDSDIEETLNAAKNSKYGARIRNILVLDSPQQWTIDCESVEIVSAKDYLAKTEYQELKNARVFNLCSSYKYQSLGYYVSLLAAAREQRPIPNVSTIQDFRIQNVVRAQAEQIEKVVAKTFKNSTDKQFVLKIYFGQSLDSKYSEIAKQIYNIFEAPLLEVTFIRTDKWEVHKVIPVALKTVSEEDKSLLPGLAQSFFGRKRFYSKPLKQYHYDLAILVNPEEESPPSNKQALEKFQKAAEKYNFYSELITKEDFSRLSEFDALFIRETTNVNHYTYRFSRKAWAEGLVVIDDPWSIMRCANKVFLTECLSLGKIPSLKTWILQKDALKNKLFEDMPFPLVLKQPDSALSRGVMKVDNSDQLQTELKRLFKISDLIIAQEFLPSDYDWRIGVLDNKPLYACKYYMAKGHWQIYDWASEAAVKSGDHLTVTIDEVPSNVLSTALKAANLIGDGFYGIDIKEIDGHAYIIEVNDNPSIDAGCEDQVLKDELYNAVIQSFLNRIKVSRNIL